MFGPSAVSRTLCAGTVTLLLALSGASHAQSDYPNRQINLVVPNVAGGSADNLARPLAQELSRHLGQTVVVENIGGASGMLAANRVLRAAPDGYTLLLGTTGDMVIAPLTSPGAAYQVSDFTPITLVGRTPLVLAAYPGLQLGSATELLAQARTRPTPFSVGIPGTTSLQAMSVAALQQAADVELLTVPYKGGAQIVTDLLAGHLDLALMTLPGALPMARTGAIDIIGVLAPERVTVAPEVATLEESGTFPNLRNDVWAALAGPPGMPPEVVERLSQAARAVLEDPAFIASRASQGDIAVPFAPPAALANLLAEEEARYRALAPTLPPS